MQDNEVDKDYAKGETGQNAPGWLCAYFFAYILLCLYFCVYIIVCIYFCVYIFCVHIFVYVFWFEDVNYFAVLNIEIDYGCKNVVYFFAVHRLVE